MRPSDAWASGKSGLSRSACSAASSASGNVLEGGASVQTRELLVRFGEGCVSGRVGRIRLDGPMKEFDAAANRLRGKAVEQGSPLQVGVIRLRLNRVDGRHGCKMSRLQGEPDSGGDIAGEIALQDEDAADRLFVGVRPAMRLIGSVDKMRRDPDSITFATDGSFDDIVDFQVGGDLAHRSVRPPIQHHRRPCDHAERLRAESTEVTDHLFGQPVGDVVALTAFCEAVERQHGDHYSPRSRPLGICRMSAVCARSAPTFTPGIELRLVGVDRTEFLVRLPVNREALLLFPASHRTHAAIQVDGDLLPRLEATLGHRALMKRRMSFGHRPSATEFRRCYFSIPRSACVAIAGQSGPRASLAAHAHCRGRPPDLRSADASRGLRRRDTCAVDGHADSRRR